MLTRGDERGFTLVELGVSMSILLLVAGALLFALESGTNAEHRASTRIDEEQSVRLVLAQFTRDMRNATSLQPNPPRYSTKPDQIDVLQGSVHVRWWYNAAAHTLIRRTYDAGGGGHDAPLNGLTNASGTVLTVSAQDGTDLFTVPDGTLADVVRCGATAAVSVTSSAQPPSKPFTETAEAPLTTSADQRGCP